MKRFYKTVTVDEAPEGFRFLLDGKAVRTPARQSLFLPTLALAEAVAAEWREQGDEMRPADMALTRLTNTVLDGIRNSRDDVIGAILRFGENDLLAYRAEAPAALVARQSQWNDILDWAAETHDARLTVTAGIAHIEQAPEALAALRQAIANRSDFELAALHVLASITGSLILGLAALDGRLTPEEAFRLSRLDEAFQAEQWGTDKEAEARAQRLAAEMRHAAMLVSLSRT